MKNKFPVLFLIMHLLLLADISASALLLMHYDDQIGLFCLIPALMLAAGCIIFFFVYTSNSMRHISRMNAHLESSAAEYMNSLPAPVAVIDGEGRLVWYNQMFSEKIGLGQDVYGIALNTLVKIDMKTVEENGSAVCQLNGGVFRVAAEKFVKNDIAFTVLYFHDDTDYFSMKLKFEDSRPSVVVINIDNYDDIMQNAKESEKAQASVKTEELIENFMKGTGGFIKKTSANSFYAVIETGKLRKIVENKFKILDEARNIRISGKYPLTFSIGVGHGASSLEESERFAMQCLDMALGRGGDQAVIKTDNGYRFFGGVSGGVEVRSRSKTRVIANALQDLIENSHRIYIMGHRFSDLDAIGAASGLAGAVTLLGKEVFIPIDREKSLGKALIDIVERETDRELFISPQEAELDIEPDDLLIIVDTHNRDYIESRKLYEKAKQVVVIDHHRKSVNFIDNTVIFCHEPHASSASEMVTELIEYFRFKDDSAKIPPCCADALLAGITLDTKNFVMRTGVRTFEAAASLKKLGADTVRVKSLFADSIDSYRRKTQIVASANIHGRCAVAVADFKSDDIRLVAPQAADDLLGISNVDASFVLYKTGSTVNISARSLGAVNVQVIMESLGGGGHQTMAAAQLEGITLRDASKMLVKAIEEREDQSGNNAKG